MDNKIGGKKKKVKMLWCILYRVVSEKTIKFVNEIEDRKMKNEWFCGGGFGWFQIFLSLVHSTSHFFAHFVLLLSQLTHNLILFLLIIIFFIFFLFLISSTCLFFFNYIFFFLSFWWFLGLFYRHCTHRPWIVSNYVITI